MYRKERDRLLTEIETLKGNGATPLEVQAREAELHILETNCLRQIGNRYFDFDSQVGPWQTDSDLKRRWLMPPQRVEAAKKIRAAKKAWVKEWIQILSPVASVIISLLAAIISLAAFAVSALALYLRMAGKAP